MNAKTSLKHQGNSLANPSNQLKVLSNTNYGIPFADQLAQSGTSCLSADRVEILQVNLGKMCNMTCAHCHVDAGPDRREIMEQAEVDACLKVLRENPEVKTLDLTGGAPEMNPLFRQFVTEARKLGRQLLTVVI